MGSRIAVCIALTIGVAISGCQKTVQKALDKSTWQQKCGWKAKDFFDDPQVIALCNAIEKNDVAEIDRLVAAGANVNAKGKGNMTPLLWAFFDGKLERFKRILEHGADPNVAVSEEFGVPGWFSQGESVTHLACKTEFPGYFEAVFAHGGNPSLISSVRLASSDSPMLAVIRGSGSDKLGKIERLIEKGADLDHMDEDGIAAVTLAASWGCRFDIALALLEAGADTSMYTQDGAQKLVHIVVRQERRRDNWAPQQKADYEKLLNWLDEHGESVDAAKTDIKRWDSWSRTTGEFHERFQAEIAERKAREAREPKTKKPAPEAK